MIKIIAVIIVLAVIVILDILFFSGILQKLGPEWKDYKLIKYSLNGKSYRLLVADTNTKRMKGLMYAKELKGADGMIFNFDTKANQSFWNQNTHLDLDVYWVDHETAVGYEHLPPIDKKGLTIINSPKPVDTVIEIVRKK